MSPKSPKSSSPPLSRAEEFSIAGAAGCDPRTVRKAVSGGYVRPSARDRIRKVLLDRGMHQLVDNLRND